MSLIETERLRLEPIDEAHFEDLAALRGDPRLMATMKGGAETREQTQATLAGYRATWRAHGFGIWAVLDRRDGSFLGECGFWLRDDGLGVALRFALIEAAQGRGMAREAAAAALAYGFEEAGLEEIVAVAQHGNEGSHRILRGFGMTPLEDPITSRAPITVYGLTCVAWAQAGLQG